MGLVCKFPQKKTKIMQTQVNSEYVCPPTLPCTLNIEVFGDKPQVTCTIYFGRRNFNEKWTDNHS